MSWPPNHPNSYNLPESEEETQQNTEITSGHLTALNENQVQNPDISQLMQIPPQAVSGDVNVGYSNGWQMDAGNSQLVQYTHQMQQQYDTYPQQYNFVPNDLNLVGNYSENLQTAQVPETYYSNFSYNPSMNYEGNQQFNSQPVHYPEMNYYQVNHPGNPTMTYPVNPVAPFQQNIYVDKPKRTRTCFTPYQLEVLQRDFTTSGKYVSKLRKAQLAKYLGLSEKSINTWFQNRRSKLRKNAVTPPLNSLSSNDSSPNSANSRSPVTNFQQPAENQSNIANGQSENDVEKWIENCQF